MGGVPDLAAAAHRQTLKGGLALDDMQNIQWFPGHMTRTRRRIQACLPLIDAVAEVVDARIPLSSRNPELDALTPGKPRLVVLNKEDIADEAATALWMDWFRKQGAAVMAADCKGGKGIGQFTPLLRRLLSDKIAQWTERGMPGHPIRVMVAGIPNSGKSSLINRLSKGGKAKVEDRPGVTRDQRWFSAGGGIELLDTPGVLWPKFEDQAVARRLAFTGAIRDQVLDGEGLACALLVLLGTVMPALCGRGTACLGICPRQGTHCSKRSGGGGVCSFREARWTPSGRRRCCSTSSGPAGSGG